MSSASMPQPDATHDLLRAMADPVRHRIVLRLNETAASPRDLADELGMPAAEIARHIAVLDECGCVAVVPGERPRAPWETRYRATATAFLDEEEWVQLPHSVRGTICRDVVCEIVEHAVAAVATDALADRAETHVTFADLTLDERGWRDLTELLAETHRRALAIQAASVDRLEARQSPGPALPSRLSVLHYPLPELGPPGHTPG